jgi:hypothetical protein
VNGIAEFLLRPRAGILRGGRMGPMIHEHINIH